MSATVSFKFHRQFNESWFQKKNKMSNNLHLHFKYTSTLQNVIFTELLKHSHNKNTDKISQNPVEAWSHTSRSVSQSRWHGVCSVASCFLFSQILRATTSSLLRWASKHKLQPPWESARPWRNKVSVRRCRLWSGSVLVGPAGRQHCAARGTWRRPGSGGGPQPVRGRSGSRWRPGRGRGRCSPCR